MRHPGDDDPCPCGGGAYATCCQPALKHVAWPQTAEALMRSRYTAFALGDADHLWRTWHPRTRPSDVGPGDTEWTRLTIIDVVDGQPRDATGVVEFEAQWRRGGRSGVLHERSSFERRAGRWCYVSPV